MAKFCFTADFHLTNHPDDSYRFDIFPWLHKQCTNRKVDALFILGDLTDKKDEHPAALVHKITEGLTTLAKVCPVYILKGNHDYAHEDSPYFQVLNDYSLPIRFFAKPTAIKVKGRKICLLPHTRDQWYYRKWDLSKYDLVLIHQSITGSVGSNGQVMRGRIRRNRFDFVKRIIAGDVHVPQKVHKVTYCGSPHPVHFGDDFQPRVLLEDNGELISINRYTLKKAILTIDSIEDLAKTGLSEGDRARVTYRLPRSEFVHWDRHRRSIEQEAERLGIELWGVKLEERQTRRQLVENDVSNKQTADPLETFGRFCQVSGIDRELVKAGREILNGRVRE